MNTRNKQTTKKTIFMTFVAAFTGFCVCSITHLPAHHPARNKIMLSSSRRTKSNRATPPTFYTKNPTNTTRTHRASSRGRPASGGSIDEVLVGGILTRSAEKKRKEEEAALSLAALSKGSDEWQKEEEDAREGERRRRGGRRRG